MSRTNRTNDLGQPIGWPVPDWTARPRPPRTPLEGRWCRLEMLDAGRHAADLFAANAEDVEGRMWTYLGVGPFADLADYRRWVESVQDKDDPLMHAVIDLATGKAVGLASYLRIDPAMGVIEVGHIAWSPRLQGTVAATEASYLFMRRVFDELNYRRYEWKCDAVNEPSRRAALRLGFTFEGIFRQAIVYKGRNRDTAWYSILDSEWPVLKVRFERWLAPSNFGPDGRQVRRLQDC
ncbi:MAG: GNAT family protein [Geminicoccaceae bacterium]